MSDSWSLPPRYPLALLPTPLVEAERLSDALDGPRILIKRDDMTGFGFGGNKIRCLEFYLAKALEQGADVLITGGGPQSNHVRATAAAARVTGLDVVAVLHGSGPEDLQGNLLLDRLLDAEVRFSGSSDRSLVDPMIDQVAEELRQAGRHPFAIPRGGATGLGALGYVECVREMNAQLVSLGLESDRVVLATGACGTQAGLLVGAKMTGAGYCIRGFTVSRPASECRERIERIARECADLIGQPIDINPDDVVVNDDYIGPGYGIPTPECIAAIRQVARTEGLFLDPTYTGKGMAGLLGEIRAGQVGSDETVIFIHTGGEPGLFAHPEIAV